MYTVEIHIPENDGLTEKMNMLWAWLDHQKYEPTTFRYMFLSRNLLFKVEFSREDEAQAFASAFAGKVTGNIGGKKTVEGTVA
jgi:hypothetical protein